MLFKLSLRNLRKSLKDYAIYFFTLILGVAVFYIFNAIEESTVLMELTSYQSGLVKLLTELLGSLSIFVCIVLAFLIIFANQFLMKRRKKEFGTYMLLGMGKQSISKILLIETFFIGLLSLLIGLIIGVISSQFMSILVANMFEVNLSRFEFVFSNLAMIKTIIFFAFIYIVVMLFNTFSVSKCKLIDLLNAKKQGECIKVKNNVVSSLLFIASILILAYAYYFVLSDELLLVGDIRIILFPIGLGCLGTVMFFYSVAGLLLNIVQANKRFYFKNLNVFVVRQINSKINTTVVSMSIISILLFLTICILSSGFSIKNAADKRSEKLIPVDVTITSPYYSPKDIEGLEKNGNVPKEVIVQNSMSIEENLIASNIDVNTAFKNKVNLNIYDYDSVSYATIFGESNKEVNINVSDPNLRHEEIIRISDYNKVAKLFGKKTYTLKENEYMMVSQKLIEERNDFLKKNKQLEIASFKLTPKYNEVKDGFIIIDSSPLNYGFTLVPDEVVSDEHIMSQYFAARFANLSETKITELNEKLLVVSENNDRLMGMSTKHRLNAEGVGLGTIATFIGFYLGIILLISGAAILALKEVSESSDNIERYEILRKIGVSEKMVNRALFTQIGVFFMLPLLLACVHSYFGMLFANNILLAFGSESLLKPIIYTGLFMIFIYGGYFLLTYICSKGIIKKQ